MIPFEGYCIILYSIADFHLLLYTRSIPLFNPVYGGVAAFLGYYSFSQAVEAWPHLISQAVDLYLLVQPAVYFVHAIPLVFLIGVRAENSTKYRNVKSGIFRFRESGFLYVGNTKELKINIQRDATREGYPDCDEGQRIPEEWSNTHYLNSPRERRESSSATSLNPRWTPL